MTALHRLESITVAPNRQRKAFDITALNELAESIAATGLLQAPVIRIANGKVTLVAGERRLRAMSDLHELGRYFSYNGEIVPAGMIPCTSLGELSFLQAWEAELEENIRRADLTWVEKAAATAELMELRRAQAAEVGAAPPTTGDLTRELRADDAYPQAHETTRKELIVSRYLDDPEVKAAPTLKEAVKILKKREERQQQAELAATVGLTFSSKFHNLVHGDAESWAAEQAAGQFDIVLTDPPYGMGADEFGDSGVGSSAAAHFYDDSYEAWQKMLSWFAPQSFRLAKPSAHLYAFCDFDRFAEFRQAMQTAGWRVHRTPLIWHNPDGFRAPWPKQGCQRKYELILYAVKGDLEVTALKGDVLEYRKDSALGHPAQKPVPLLIDLLRRSARAGHRVIDFFAGSGSTVEAAHELKLSCTGVEQDASAYGIAVKRLAELKKLEEELF